MKILSDFSLTELYEILASFPKFRAKQVFDCIHQAKDYDDTNLPKDMVEKLKSDYMLKPIDILKVLASKDGTKKYLLKLYDNNIVECVFLTQDYGNTICMSTQVGCRMGCKFCASTLNGRVRDLTAGEMLSTIAVVNADNGKRTERNFSNIVLMGSGEPFDNYDNVIKWLELITDVNGFNVSERNISLSTCGLVDKIYEFAKLNFNITLCISLHATTDEKRKEIMPIANAYSIAEIVKALKFYIKENKRRVVFEYCLIKDVNDSEDDIKRLKDITKGLLSHVNVICLNPNGGSLKATTKQEALDFVANLNKMGVSATLRRSQGSDIEGACGMLRAKTLKEKE
ncbi:MAG: 23S rRNA (adenine(2503)-C(2))-methyltransferase RlmN [Clostridia bacterium]|nr:23S rRNA (adenine(2503)-C(2))-methyltransferase RlmN [Clostridia bacterium]